MSEIAPTTPNQHETLQTGERLGVDLAGVVIDALKHPGDDFLETPAIEGAFDAIASLQEQFDDIHVISVCRESSEPDIMTWLKHYDFFGKTDIPEENVHFCRENEDKAGIAKEYGVTHFVDDTNEVLSAMDGQLEGLALFNRDTVSVPQKKALRDWSDANVEKLLRAWSKAETSQAE